MRFYAGAPLTTKDGLGLGSLCIIDTKPRPVLNERDVAMLVHFSNLVMNRLISLRNITYRDQYTGLFNRVRMEEDIIKHEIKGNKILVVIDMLSPNFLNELVRALGYSFAQAITDIMKNALQEELPPWAILYKISPTRFGFISKNNGPENTELFVRILDRFKYPLICESIPLQMQLGIGAIPLTSTNNGEKDWLRLVISAADEARNTRCGWQWYEPHLDMAHQRAFLLLGSLAEALHAPDQLSLVFQPVIDIVTGQVVTVEALLRWQHAILGPISPAEFIPLAEKTALIKSVSLWVMQKVIDQAFIWQNMDKTFAVAMNVSANDLDDPNFTDMLLNYVMNTGLDPSLLKIEFTESALSSDLKMVRTQLERMRDAGIHIAIDDFGSGYSNWAYLRNLPASIIKIDKSLIDGIMRDEAGATLVASIIKICSNLGYRVVAEGVETSDTLEALRKMECHEIQGFLFARPMKQEALEEWITTFFPKELLL